MKSLHPYYTKKRISSLKSLSLALEVPEDVLLNISDNADDYYFQNSPKIKESGEKRYTYTVKPTLKAIQEKIKIKIFYNVFFPSYLQGAIRSDTTKRDFIYDAAIHANSRYFISEDVSNFFPSITYEKVYELWSEFFGFSRSVSTILTQLTTYKGIVPQGSKTASYIANLLFWREEGDFVLQLKKKGIIYTRFVDDVTISSRSPIQASEKTRIISNLYSMMRRGGVRPNRKKHFMGSTKNNVQVHNLCVSGSKPSLGKKKLNEVRMAVYNCQKMAHECGTSNSDYFKMYTSTMSKLGMMGRLHPNKAKRYKDQLSQYKPKS